MNTSNIIFKPVREERTNTVGSSIIQNKANDGWMDLSDSLPWNEVMRLTRSIIGVLCLGKELLTIH